MRIRSAVAAVATVALAMGMTSYAGAAPDDPETDAVTDAAAAAETVIAPTEEAAEDALEDAELLFDDDPDSMPAGDRDATLVLRDLALSRDKLSGSQRASANRMLARPGAQKKKCAKHVCVHWSTTGQHRVSKKDRKPRNGTPDYVDKVLKTMERVHKTYVKAGYRAPKKDQGQGGNRKRDVYLRNVGVQGLYGYCTSDRSARTVAAYCVLDNNFSRAEFPTNTPIENMKVTAAHEYFHAVQFAYDYFEDGWFMEATATWAEDELFDGVNDNVNYLPYGQMRRPDVPLDGFIDLNVYGNWVYFRYLTERLPTSKAGLPVLVRDMWREAGVGGGLPNRYSTNAIAVALARKGRNFADTYAQFAEANRRSRTTYSEGAANRYPAPPVYRNVELASGETNTSAPVLDHLTSASARFRRGSGSTLDVDVNMGAAVQSPRAIVTVGSTTGVKTYFVPLDANGDGTRTVAFGAGVVYVEVALVNASTRFAGCGSGSFLWSCNGTPVDDNRPAALTVTVNP